jgi:ATP-binding cassette subfamily B protein
MAFPFYRQFDEMDCGPTCLRMISKHHGRSYSLQTLRQLSDTTREGSSLLNLSNAGEKLGFRTVGAKISFEQLEELPLPAVIHWDKKHFVVVYKVKKNKVFIADPAFGKSTYTRQQFIAKWIGNNADENTKGGLILIFEPTPEFYEKDLKNPETENNKGGLSFLLDYIRSYKRYVVQLAFGILAGSILQLIFPFLTQSIVDTGIRSQKINFIYLILMAQMFLFIGKMTIDIIQNWILLHLSTRINVSLISDFFIKLTNLPISFFDVKMTGDIMQRIEDHQRIDRILTSGSLNVLFSVFSVLVFGIVLCYYSPTILLIFLAGSSIFFGWIFFFMKKRKELDHKNFHLLSEENSKVMELINGMQEIKLHNAEKKKRWSWEYVQARLFKVKVKSLALYNKQTSGAMFFNESKNILITAYAAQLVITGHITLGMMLSISYIIGQLNSPLMRMVEFVYQLQDARLSLERLKEIHHHKSEDENLQNQMSVPELGSIKIDKLSFRYKGSRQNLFTDLSLEIPRNKTTAIVGASGSGKTTLMKLLMKFYEPDGGNIKIGYQDMNAISNKQWRDHFGAVMQDGFIFNDSILENIIVGDDEIDKAKLLRSVEVANIKEFIQGLALNFNTRIGQDGIGLSGGQKQRILIARAVYKNPDFIFFDEATSALDANNEREITENLQQFLKDKTAVIIAHRLSTVKHADKIVVLDNGKIIEEGSHYDLIEKRGAYFNLVKNQLELEKITNYA